MSSSGRRKTQREMQIAYEVEFCYRQRVAQLRQQAADREELTGNAALRDEERREAARAAKANRSALDGGER